MWVLLLDELDYTVEYKPDCLYKHANRLSRLFEEMGTVDIDDGLPDDILVLITVLPLWYAQIIDFFNTPTIP